MVLSTRSRSLIFFLLLFNFCSVCFAAENDFEYKLKALYISRLADFISWPADKIKHHFIICIDTDDKVAQQLLSLDIVKILKRPVKIIPPPAASDIKQCDVLYISSEKVDLSITEYPILTLGSHPGFAKQGGIIEFYIAENKVRMKANLSAARKAGIKISSKLIRLLKIVVPEEASHD